MPNIPTELLIKIYNNARKQARRQVYKPIRKHYNVHLFG